jgi:drug/metabolite transporter (DMT)-like permease
MSFNCKPLNNKVKTYSALVLSMIFWAFSFIWFKLANKTFPPITIVFIRLLFSVILLTVYLVLAKGFMKIRKGDLKLFLMMALFEPFFYFIGESFGLTYVSATVCSVLVSLIPVFATIGAWIIFKEKLSRINYAGIIISFIGVLVFLLNKDGSISYNLKGLAFLFFAVLSAVGYNLTLSRLVDRYSPVYIVNVQNIIGATLFLPLFIISDFSTFIHKSYTPVMFLPILALAAFASCSAFILFAYSVKRVGILKANVFTNFIPLFTAIFSFILMGERLTFQNIIGMIVVIAGIIMAQLNGRIKSIDEALTLTGKTA